MALTIRLRQQGRTNRKLYRLVVTNTKSPREGRYVEMLGWYNPHEQEGEKQLSIAADRVDHWLKHGALISEKADPHRPILFVDRIDVQDISSYSEATPKKIYIPPLVMDLNQLSYCLLPRQDSPFFGIKQHVVVGLGRPKTVYTGDTRHDNYILPVQEGPGG